jgi:hypothetical protein
MYPILYNADGSKSSSKSLMNMLNQRVRENMGDTCSSLQLNGSINATDFNMIDTNGNIVGRFSTLFNQYNPGSGRIISPSSVTVPPNSVTSPPSSITSPSTGMVGTVCSSNSDCLNNNCAHTDGSDASTITCCKYDMHHDYTYSKDYCAHLDYGTACSNNESCASGYCTNSGATPGICTLANPGDLGKIILLFNNMFNKYLSAPDSTTKSLYKSMLPTVSMLKDKYDIQYFNDYTANAFASNKQLPIA